MESISIKNFAGIDNLEISLNKFNVFIGAQASGKSVTAKLIYFFKSITWEFLSGAMDGKSRLEVDKKLLSKFEDYFPEDTWPSKSFEIVYHFNNNHHIIVKKEKIKLKISYPEAVGKLFSDCKEIIKEERKKRQGREKFETFRYDYVVYDKYWAMVEKELGSNAGFNGLFIPAGRSFFAHLQNSIFSFLSTNKAIDPFLVEFGSYYEQIKGIAFEILGPDDKQIGLKADSLILEIIGGEYQLEGNKDYLLHKDKRRIKVAFSSSGQQETLPLLLILRSLLGDSFADNDSSLFIEEPEAHLFPAAQKKVVELMGLIFNNSIHSSQLIITTHSPYILTSINNLVQASIIHKSVVGKEKKRVEQIVPEEIMIDSKQLNAYVFKDGSAESIIDTETGLIYAMYLDKVSEDIAIQFDNLLNL